MTLRNYEEKLMNCQSEMEKQIIKGTIDGIKMQLSEIDKENESSKIASSHANDRKK